MEFHSSYECFYLEVPQRRKSPLYVFTPQLANAKPKNPNTPGDPLKGPPPPWAGLHPCRSVKRQPLQNNGLQRPCLALFPQTCPVFNNKNSLNNKKSLKPKTLYALSPPAARRRNARKIPVFKEVLLPEPSIMTVAI